MLKEENSVQNFFFFIYAGAGPLNRLRPKCLGSGRLCNTDGTGNSSRTGWTKKWKKEVESRVADYNLVRAWPDFENLTVRRKYSENL